MNGKAGGKKPRKKISIDSKEVVIWPTESKV